MWGRSDLGPRFRTSVIVFLLPVRRRTDVGQWTVGLQMVRRHFGRHSSQFMGGTTAWTDRRTYHSIRLYPACRRTADAARSVGVFTSSSLLQGVLPSRPNRARIVFRNEPPSGHNHGPSASRHWCVSFRSARQLWTTGANWPCSWDWSAVGLSAVPIYNEGQFWLWGIGFWLWALSLLFSRAFGPRLCRLLLTDSHLAGSLPWPLLLRPARLVTLSAVLKAVLLSPVFRSESLVDLGLNIGLPLLKKP